MNTTITKSLPANLLIVAALAAFAITPGIAVGQDHDHAGHDHDGHDHDGHNHGDHAHSGEELAFHLPQWKSMHFDAAQKAAQHAATVKKLGCEANQDSHDGHIDVTYRCATWKTLQVKNHKLAEQWSRWLKGSGFDVSHSHTDPAFQKGKEAVEFRMVNWKRIHGDGSAKEAQMISMLQKIGAEVRVDNHGGHSDIAFRAPTWRDLHVATHEEADQWMGWLKQNGFETRHEH